MAGSHRARTVGLVRSRLAGCRLRGGLRGGRAVCGLRPAACGLRSASPPLPPLRVLAGSASSPALGGGGVLDLGPSHRPVVG